MLALKGFRCFSIRSGLVVEGTLQTLLHTEIPEHKARIELNASDPQSDSDSLMFPWELGL